MEEELESVGENMKVLETSSEKAMAREEKLIDKILQFQYKYKAAEARYQRLYSSDFSVSSVIFLVYGNVLRPNLRT